MKEIGYILLSIVKKEETDMKRMMSIILFVNLILVLSSCHPRHVSDIKLAMTKEEVISLWGPTDLITYKTVNGTTHETWEYHFANSGSVCWITFIQDRTAENPKCRRFPAGGWYYSPQPYYYYPYPYPYPYYYGGFYRFSHPY